MVRQCKEQNRDNWCMCGNSQKRGRDINARDCLLLKIHASRNKTRKEFILGLQWISLIFNSLHLQQSLRQGYGRVLRKIPCLCVIPKDAVSLLTSVCFTSHTGLLPEEYDISSPLYFLFSLLRLWGYLKFSQFSNFTTFNNNRTSSYLPQNKPSEVKNGGSEFLFLKSSVWQWIDTEIACTCSWRSEEHWYVTPSSASLFSVGNKRYIQEGHLTTHHKYWVTYGPPLLWSQVNANLANTFLCHGIHSWYTTELLGLLSSFRPVKESSISTVALKVLK